MTITDEAITTNGHAKGRAVPSEYTSRLPSITLSSGYTVYLRRQPGDVMPKAQAAAQRELEAGKPSIPTQRLETAPGEFHDVANDEDDNYKAALADWQQQVARLSSEKLLKLMTRLALVFEVDTDALAAMRDEYTDLGIDLPSDDRAAWLSYVLAPTMEDQGRLFEEVYGRALPQEAQVALHRAMFPSDVEGHADRASDRPEIAG